MKVYRLFILLFILTGLSAPLGLNATVTSGDSVRVDSGSSVMVDMHGTCKTISYSGAGSVFVPTRTSQEYNRFISAPPIGVTLTDC